MDKKKYNLVFAIFIISILVFSILGYAFKGSSNTTKFKGFKFVRDNQGLWTVRINDRQIYLFNNPKELNNISDINLDITKLNNFNKVYISTDPSESLNNLLGGFSVNILPLITTISRPACFVDINTCKDLPLKDCSNTDIDTGVILIKKSNINKIEYLNNCLTIQGDSEELKKLIDKWTLELYING